MHIFFKPNNCLRGSEFFWLILLSAIWKRKRGRLWYQRIESTW